ncbi:MAG: hypothetical protein QOH48_1974, partial [Actinomycetota bacterium]|nr:hypothetical protein [Actinomycetota bacterium]
MELYPPGVQGKNGGLAAEQQQGSETGTVLVDASLPGLHMG